VNDPARGLRPGTAEPPAALRARYADWVWEVAWQYGAPAVTYRLTSNDGECRFLKLTRGIQYPTLTAEASRMRWAADHLPVPRVIEEGREEDVTWLVTAGLPGRDATALTADPGRLVRALATGLRSFHESPVDLCPFDFRLEAALQHARSRLAAGHILPARDFHPEFEALSAEEAIGRLERTCATTEDLVVCHGDYCLPNVLLRADSSGEDLSVCGFVDLGELGIADRWWDLAVATWSLTWNLGPGFEDEFLRLYGVTPDPRRVEFYRLLYDVVS
jgi:kanamycin kinase